MCRSICDPGRELELPWAAAAAGHIVEDLLGSYIVREREENVPCCALAVTRNEIIYTARI